MSTSPIDFHQYEVTPVQEGMQTQVRRVIPRLRRFGPVTEFGRSDTPGYDWHFRDRQKRWHDLRDAELRKHLPYTVGDELWVREVVRAEQDHEDTWDHLVRYLADDKTVKVADHDDNCSDAFAQWWLLSCYRASDPDLDGGKIVPSRSMPRWASRTTLIVQAVRVERLQDISEADAVASGVEDRGPGIGYRVRLPNGGRVHSGSAKQCFASVWVDLHGEDSWIANPWVVVLSVKPLPIPVPAEDAVGVGRDA